MAESRMAKSVHKPGPKPATASDGASKTGEISSAAASNKGEGGDGCKSWVLDDKWKIPFVPQLRGVDERADEFIAKFRNDRKLEREHSIEEFEEMLKRSA